MYGESLIEIEHLKGELDRKREEPKRERVMVNNHAEIEVQLLKERNFELEKQLNDLRSDVS